MPKVSTIVVEKPAPPTNPLVDRTRLLTTEEVSRWFRVSRKYIWDISMNRKGEERLPSYKMGRRRLYLYDECYWFLKKQES